MDTKPANPQDVLKALIGKESSKLVQALAEKSVRIQNKYDYYNADNDIRDFGISVPRSMINSRPGIGWASRAVNTLADRVIFDGFAGDNYGINTLLEDTGAISIINNTTHDAFIAGCSFVAIVNDQDGNKALMPFTAQEATGIRDQRTGLLKVGLAVTKWGFPSKKKTASLSPENYVLFTPEYTAVYINRTLYEVVANPTKRTLLHPLTHRASADQPLGKSRITNTVRRIINEVGRMKRRSEIAQEFYSTPQRYMTGLAEDAKKDASLDSAIGKLWAITKDGDGESPKVGQLDQMSIEGFVNAKKDLARDFCAETALTLRNLGYETGNPTSAESLSAMSDDLLLEATNSQAEMGEEIKQLAITLRMAIDRVDVVPSGLKELRPAWRPVFQTDLAQAGDAAFKLLQAMPELAGSPQIYQMLGIGVRDAEKLLAARAKLQASSFMQGGQ